MLLERVRCLAGPALARTAQDDDEHLVPVAERALPAVRELFTDLLDEGITRGQSVVTNNGRLHCQNSKQLAISEFPAQNALQ